MVSLPSPLLALLTDKSKVSFVKLNLTPSFLSSETEATRSTEFKKSFKSISNFFYYFLELLVCNLEIYHQLI